MQLLSFLVFEKTNMEALRAKGVKLSGFMIEMLQNTFQENINIITPIEEESRGCQGMHLRFFKQQIESGINIWN